MLIAATMIIGFPLGLLFAVGEAMTISHRNRSRGMVD